MTYLDTQHPIPQPPPSILMVGEPGYKTRGYAIAWAFFLGGIGAHEFYLNRPGRGIMYALFFWTAVPAVLAWVQVIMYLCMNDQKWDNKFNRRPVYYTR